MECRADAEDLLKVTDSIFNIFQIIRCKSEHLGNGASDVTLVLNANRNDIWPTEYCHFRQP